MIEKSIVFMAKRVTIMIDDDLDKKLREKQAKVIFQEQRTCSYSKIINEVLYKAKFKNN